MNSTRTFLFNLMDFETSGSSPRRCLDLRIHQALNAFPPQSLKAQVKTDRFATQGTPSTAHCEAIWLENLASSPYKVQRESETTKIQQNCFEVTVLHQYNMKFDLKNRTCVCPYPSNTLSKRSETSTLETHQSNLLLQSHRDYQADQSWIKRNFYANFAKFFPIHFCNCFKNINKNTCPLIEEWSWSRALQPFSCPHVVALKFPLSNFCYSNPPPPLWQLYELLILKEMHGNATS